MKKEKKMNYKKMLEDIDNLVNNDLGVDWEYKAEVSKMPFTQEEAQEMARIITKVYVISHSVHCSACGKKYEGK